ncbi:lasso peptide biosynthesis PqqD family chaperone [Streptomyces griseorubiginosus]|uniref:lasso peptide biosynthesis PqqD family chaperone n=1 Tax=Streptomyces griseorubiginosus TaxID=67304 RepID=UPI0036E49250
MTVALAPHVTLTEVEGGMVLLDQRVGRFWQLNRSGAATVRLLLEGRSPEDVATHLSRQSPDAAERAVGDVRALLDALTRARLVVSTS